MAPQEMDVIETRSTMLENRSTNTDQEIAEGWAGKRAAASDQFEQLGMPHKGLEDWKYIDLAKYIEAGNAAKANDGLANLDLGIPEAWPTMQVMNGASSLQHTIVEGATISKLEGIEEQHLLKYFGQGVGFGFHGLVAQNGAEATEGMVVHVPKKMRLIAPIVLDARQSTAGTQQLRNIVVAEELSEVTILELYSTDSGTTNVVTEVFAEEGAKVEVIRIHLSGEAGNLVHTTALTAKRSATVKHYAFNLGGVLSRNDVIVTLAGENSEGHLHGFYSAKAGQLVDNHTLVDHAVPNCYSNEKYKGIAEEGGITVFNGKILVRPDAQKTNAYQNNNNLMLSPGAVMNTKPQLEIFADDVKCSHGATIGQMDETSVFYLQSRGIPKEEATKLLIDAYAGEIYNEIDHAEVRQWVQGVVVAHLQALGI